MKIAIISDSHDNLANIKILADWLKAHPVDLAIHCGDVAADETVKFLAQNIAAPLHLVYGNMDKNYRDQIYEASDELENVQLHGDQGELTLGSIKIAFCHFPEQARRLAQSGQYQLVLYGHTHQPWLETLANNCQLINPGTLAGLFNKASFAVYDTDSGKLELKVLERL